MFFPIYWMISSGFKNEVDVFSKKPKFLFEPTLNTFLTVIDQSDYFHFALNSIIISISATAFSLLLANNNEKAVAEIDIIIEFNAKWK